MIIAHDVVDEVVIALPIKSQYAQIEAAINLLEEQGIMVHLFSDTFPHQLATSRPSEFDVTSAGVLRDVSDKITIIRYPIDS